MRRGSRPAARRSTTLARSPRWRDRTRPHTLGIHPRRASVRLLAPYRLPPHGRPPARPYDEGIVQSRNAESDDDDDVVDLGPETPLPQPPRPSPRPILLPRERAERERARAERERSIAQRLRERARVEDGPL